MRARVVLWAAVQRPAAGRRGAGRHAARRRAARRAALAPALAAGLFLVAALPLPRPAGAAEKGGAAAGAAGAQEAGAGTTAGAATEGAGAPRELRVCADPNNLPFSNSRLEGFENRIAELLARELHARLSYTWWPQRRGFVRNTLRAGLCDVMIGAPRDYELVLTTRPYYRSTYVFVYRKGEGPAVRSLDDPVLRRVKVGVQLIGDDYMNTPPAHALTRRGIVNNVVGFRIYGDYAEPNPPARIVDAVADGTIDVAIVWGPLAGYFATREKVPLEVVPVQQPADGRDFPLAYDIAMGVRRGDTALKTELEAILDRRQAEIRRILEEYGVPLVGDAG